MSSTRKAVPVHRPEAGETVLAAKGRVAKGLRDGGRSVAHVMTDERGRTGRIVADRIIADPAVVDPEEPDQDGAGRRQSCRHLPAMV
jgi:hypothetical protein